MMFWYDHGINGWGYALMIISMIAFWTLLITGVMYLVRQPSAAGQKDSLLRNTRTAEQLLAERFARGEIDENEFNGRIATLHGKVLS